MIKWLCKYLYEIAKKSLLPPTTNICLAWCI
jgi:hypothetical protein